MRPARSSSFRWKDKVAPACRVLRRWRQPSRLGPARTSRRKIAKRVILAKADSADRASFDFYFYNNGNIGEIQSCSGEFWTDDPVKY